MFVIRPARMGDMEQLERCVTAADVGMTHPPRHRQGLESVIQRSVDALQRQIDIIENEVYLFVLEDLSTQTIGGICSILANVGVQHPFYVFHIEEASPLPPPLPPLLEKRLLRLGVYEGKASEVCALYLTPEFRKEGLGKLLSLSRFLFIANFPNRFQETLIANMRGVISNHHTPFWDHLGRRFLNISFKEVMALREKGEQFVPSLFPPYPFPVALLSEEASKVIEAVNVDAQPALAMLLREGFTRSAQIDPFDGGPILHANKRSTRVLRESQVRKVGKIQDKVDGEKALLANTDPQFLACYGSLMQDSKKNWIIEKAVAEALKVEVGDWVRAI